MPSLEVSIILIDGGLGKKTDLVSTGHFGVTVEQVCEKCAAGRT
jgi:hypothetical protein